MQKQMQDLYLKHDLRQVRIHELLDPVFSSRQHALLKQLGNKEENKMQIESKRRERSNGMWAGYWAGVRSVCCTALDANHSKGDSEGSAPFSLLQ